MIGWTLRRVLRLLLLLPRLPLLLLGAVLRLSAGPRVVSVRLKGRVSELAPKPPWQRLLPGQEERLSVQEALEALRLAREDGATRAVLLQLDGAQLGLVQAEELLLALDRLRQAGKKVLVWSDGAAAPALVAGAGGDRALSVPAGQLDFLGLRVRAVFLRDLLEVAGVVPQLDHEGDYKTASDMFTHRTMSPAHREMAEDLGGDLYDQVLTPLVVRRELERAELTGLLDDAPVANERAVEAGVLQGVAYRDELPARVGELAGLGEEPRTIGALDLLGRERQRMRLYDVVADRPVVALVPLSGPIAGGEEGQGCRSLAAVRVLDGLREDRRVKAVVLRIDSPGGSALASDEMWRAIRRLDEEKPVVASLGRVAASGGYYAAVGARKIVAHGSTLTGSIGIVSGKFHLAPALFRAGVRVEGVGFGARSGMYDPDRGFDPGEDAAHRREMLRFYRVFLERVAAGRKMEVDAVDALAKGRVYTGRRAAALGLVDRVGGLEAAVEEARGLAGIQGPHRLVHAPLAKRGLFSMLQPHGAAASGGAPWDALAEPLALLEQAVTLGRERALALCLWDVDGI